MVAVDTAVDTAVGMEEGDRGVPKIYADQNGRYFFVFTLTS